MKRSGLQIIGISFSLFFSSLAMAASQLPPSMTFVSVMPVKEIRIGSPKIETYRDRDETPFMARITKPYEIQTTEVTQLQWFQVMGNNPSHFSKVEDCPRKYIDKNGEGLCSDFPVEQVSYFNALAFIEKLNALDAKYQYRLPTEVEWEYSARAGTQGMYSFIKKEFRMNSWEDKVQCPNADENSSSTSTPLKECLMKHGLFSENSKTTVHPRGQALSVKSKRPNAWKIYGMLGGVWEWVHDRYGDYPKAPLSIDYQGPKSGSSRVLRGGSWDSLPRNLRSAYRNTNSPDSHHSDIGFRVVRTLRETR